MIPGNTRTAGRIAASALLSAAVVSLVFAVPPLRRVATQIVHLQVGWVVAAVALELAS